MFELGNAYKNQLIDQYAENKYYSENIKIDMKDKNNAKAIIANHINKNSVCLDVGCGVGYLGEILHKHRGAKVYGIDLDQKALEYATKKKCFEKLYNFSITDLKGEEYNKFVNARLKFDYIIFADVVEHVVDAEKLLRTFAKFLDDGGKMLISLPNVAHFDIIRGLINGKFNYSHIGLLDNTHLRFYTKSSFLELIQQINEIYNQNFVIKEIGRTIVKPEYLKEYPGMYKILNRDKEACVLQYIYEISIGKKGTSEQQVKEKNTFDEIEKIIENAERIQIEHDRLQARVLELEKGIDNIYKSKSWKITKPIRGITNISKKIKGSNYDKESN